MEAVPLRRRGELHALRMPMMTTVSDDEKNDVKRQNKISPVERVVVLVLSLRVVKRVAVGPEREWLGEREQDKGRGG